MVIHWTISFKSLRSGSNYVVNIYDSSYSGPPIPLKGADEPFTTQEDNNDDVYTPIRTQTGYLRIVDDGKDADGNAFDWKQLLPSSDRARPVILTRDSTVVWQGFLQTQDFSGTLYGNPQEREIPIQCGLSVLNGIQPVPDTMGAKNFANILALIIAAMETGSGFVLNYDTIRVQGSNDAIQWLLKRIDWMNFFKEGDALDEYIPKYSLFEIFEDMCKFWGWTCRVFNKTLYLTRPGDADEPKWLILNRSQLNALATGSTAGQYGISSSTVSISGDVFASTDNEDIKVRGCNKASVKADANEQDTIIAFANETIRKAMDAGGYTWVAGEDAGTGYFTTPVIRSVESTTFKGTSNVYGGFCRRQIFSAAEDKKATECDMFVFQNGYVLNANIVQIQTKHPMVLGGGSLKFSASVYEGYRKAVEHTEEDDYIKVRIGIGETYATASWFFCNYDAATHTVYYGWGNMQSDVPLVVVNGTVEGVGVMGKIAGFIPELTIMVTATIPVSDGLFGNIYIDFLGFVTNYKHIVDYFEIGNFNIEYSRDNTFLPSNSSIDRPRVMNEADRDSSAEYIAFNSNSAGDEWNADCIIASDNHMKYGYGLVINPDNTFMETAVFNGKEKHPEQHQAERVAAFWNSPKRKIVAEFRQNVIPAITPSTVVTIDHTTCHPMAISFNWRDDIEIITLIQTE